MVDDLIKRKKQNIKIKTSMQDGGFLLLESNYKQLIEGFASISFFADNQDITIYETNIAEKTDDFIVLDLAEFLNQFTANEYKMIVKFKIDLDLKENDIIECFIMEEIER